MGRLTSSPPASAEYRVGMDSTFRFVARLPASPATRTCTGSAEHPLTTIVVKYYQSVAELAASVPSGPRRRPNLACPGELRTSQQVVDALEDEVSQALEIVAP